MADDGEEFIFTLKDGQRFKVKGPPGATLDDANGKLSELQKHFPKLQGTIAKAPLSPELQERLKNRPVETDPSIGEQITGGLGAGLGSAVLGDLQLGATLSRDPLTQEEMEKAYGPSFKAVQGLRNRLLNKPAFEVSEAVPRAVQTVLEHKLGGLTGKAITAVGAPAVAGQMIGHGLGGALSGATKPVRSEDVAGKKLENTALDAIIDTVTGGVSHVAEGAIGGLEGLVKKGARKLLPSADELIPDITKPAAKAAAKAAAHGEGAGVIATEAEEAGEGEEESAGKMAYERIKNMATHRGAKAATKQAVEGAIAGDTKGKTKRRVKDAVEEAAGEVGGESGEKQERTEAPEPPFTAQEGKALKARLGTVDRRVLDVIARMPVNDQRILLRPFLGPSPQPGVVPKRPVPAVPPRIAPAPPRVEPVGDPLSHSHPGHGSLGLMPSDDEDPLGAAQQYVGELSGFRGP